MNLKRIVLMAPLALLLPALTATAAVAQVGSADGEVPLSAWCNTLAVNATVTMRARQNGVPLSQILGLIEENLSGTAGSAVGTARDVALRAYEQPAFQGEEFKQRAVTEFSNEIMVECYRTNG